MKCGLSFLHQRMPSHSRVSISFSNIGAQGMLHRVAFIQYATAPNESPSQKAKWYENVQSTAPQKPVNAQPLKPGEHSFAELKNKINFAEVSKGAELSKQGQKLQRAHEALQQEIEKRKGKKQQTFWEMRKDYGNAFFIQIVTLYIAGFATMLYVVYVLGWFRLQALLKYFDMEWVYEKSPLGCDALSAFTLNEVVQLFVFPLLVAIHVFLRA